MQKIIITGGMGYIGSHTTIALQTSGFDVVILDNLSNSDVKTLDRIESITGIRPTFEQVDCTNTDALQNVFNRHRDAAGVIHFAALKAVGESVDKPVLYYKNNLGSLLNILECMQKFNVKNIVFSSSACVYGEPEKSPVTEDTPLQPATSPYGATKVIGENIIRDTIRADENISAILLRYFNPIGAHVSGKIGELPNGVPNNLLPYITQVACGIREKLSIFGNDYGTSDGFCVRDYIDVNDVADAHVAAIKRMIENSQKSNFEIFNIGTGRGVSVMELVRAFENANDIKINFCIAPRRAGDVASNYADVSLAISELNWRAKRELTDTLKSAWKWQKHLSETERISE